MILGGFKLCTSPNRIFYWTRGPDKFTKFTFGESVHHIEIDSRGKVSISYDDWVSPDCYKLVTDFYTVGCGKCMECKLKRAKDRSVRMFMETFTNGLDNAHFVTLTYDELHLPRHWFIDSDGEYRCTHSLRKEHIQRFIKRLRKNLFGNAKGDLRYVAVGEYGDSNYRPHYHIIFWNLPLNDLKVDMEPTQTGSIQYTSEFLEKYWYEDQSDKSLLGRIRVSYVESGSISYVARYVQKKMYGDERFKYDESCLVPPFILQSKGIGKDYLIQNKERLLENGEIYESLNGESVHLTPDRYFDKLMLKESPDLEEDFAARNEQFAYLREKKIDKELSRTTKAYQDYMKLKNEKVNARIKPLIRKGEFE